MVKSLNIQSVIQLLFVWELLRMLGAETRSYNLTSSNWANKNMAKQIK